MLKGANTYPLQIRRAYHPDGSQRACNQVLLGLSSCYMFFHHYFRYHQLLSTHRVTIADLNLARQEVPGVKKSMRLCSSRVDADCNAGHAAARAAISSTC